MTAWLADGPRQVTEFRDRTSASWYAAHAVEAAMLVVAVALIVHLVRDVRRQGRLLTFDVMFCLCGATLWWADEALNFWVPAFLPSSNFVNMNNPLGHMPGMINPDIGRAPDPLLFTIPLESAGMLLGVWLLCWLAGRIRQRRPQISTAKLLLVLFATPLPREIETAPNYDTIPGTPRGREPAALGPRSRGGVSSRRQVDGGRSDSPPPTARS